MQEMMEMYRDLGISPQVLAFGNQIEAELKERFQEIDENAEYNQLKVLHAMQKNKVSEGCLYSSTGYGYNDLGRDTLEEVYAAAFHTEAALVRPLIACGTHALSVALAGNLRPGDELLSPVGKPYDTLEEVIGIRQSKGSLAEYGITYRQVELLEDGSFDYEGIRNAITDKTKMVEIQRSKGYLTRPTFSVSQIGELISFIKGIKPDIICMVDNCYGEFIETIEPSEVGADLMAGSLMKNIGGGVALGGGYIVGKAEYVKQAENRFTVPGVGGEYGATYGLMRSLFQGLFFAPHVSIEAVKTAVFTARVMEIAGFKVFPASKDKRTDIIQAIEFNDPKKLVNFCSGIQAGSPIDSFAVCEPWAMPGYDCDIVMAAGAFISGSTIELSADGPIRPPYIAYMQGGLNFEHGKIGVLIGLSRTLEE